MQRTKRSAFIIVGMAILIAIGGIAFFVAPRGRPFEVRAPDESPPLELDRFEAISVTIDGVKPGPAGLPLIQGEQREIRVSVVMSPGFDPPQILRAVLKADGRKTDNLAIALRVLRPAQPDRLEFARTLNVPESYFGECELRITAQFERDERALIFKLPVTISAPPTPDD